MAQTIIKLIVFLQNLIEFQTMPAWQHFFSFFLLPLPPNNATKQAVAVGMVLLSKHLWCKTETVRLWMETCRHRSKDLTWASPGGAEPFVAFQCCTAQCSPPTAPLHSRYQLEASTADEAKSEEKNKEGGGQMLQRMGEKWKRGKDTAEKRHNLITKCTSCKPSTKEQWTIEKLKFEGDSTDKLQGALQPDRKWRHHCCASTPSPITIKETPDQTMQQLNSPVVAGFQQEAAAFTTSFLVASNSV